ncbi:hypothetical protein WR25_20539 [Diploscapter pachys]|uniref:FAD/NAD(P)-binding domain-containing protein n=1 Tax=Diploscapter pachys TaxID=2018661 RepID=A0A2A2K0E6_9BILA|nr:hypothetical protein WR25_20539 [Diploscapter pachys]
MREQAEKYGAYREDKKVTAIVPEGDDFRIVTDDGDFRARTVLLATGVVNHRPNILPEVHDPALERGLMRYCPICDGYEVTDKRVGVIGTGDHGMREALFLRGYTRDVTLIAPEAEHALDAACAATLDEAGIVRVDGPCGGWAIEGDRIALDTAGGRMAFDSVYPALGSRIRSHLAIAAGARASDEGCLEVDDHQRTSVAGLFAAGDVVKGLDQISHAMGEAGVAATTIRNLLAELGVYRQRVCAPLRHGVGVHGDHEALAVGAFDFEHVAGTEIFDEHDAAQVFARGRHGGQADEIGVIIFALPQRRQRRAGDDEFGAAQCLGCVAIGDFGEAGDQAVVARLRRLQRQRAAVEALIGAEILGEDLEPHLAVDAMRADDDRENDGRVSLGRVIRRCLLGHRHPLLRDR